MTLQRHHILMAKGYKTPALIRSTYGNMPNISNAAVNAGATPTEGNLMVICVAGIQNRTASSPGVGWSTITTVTSNGCCIWYYKIAASGELSSWSLSTGSSLQGGWLYSEFSNIDSNGHYGNAHNTQNGVNVTSVNVPSVHVLRPGFVINNLVFPTGAAGTNWGPQNLGYALLGGVTQAQNHFTKWSYKIYNKIAYNQVANWTGNTCAPNCGVIAFGAKRNN